MLEKQSEKIRNCLRHAEQCAHRAKIEPDPNLRDYLDMEQRWLRLARSFQFSESREVYSKHDNKRQDEAIDILNWLMRRIADPDVRCVTNSLAKAIS